MIISENTSRECSASKQHSHVEAHIWQSSTKISKIFLENEIQILQEKNSTFLCCILRFSRALKAEI